MKKPNHFETKLPFTGFYQSAFEHCLDDEVNYYLDGVSDSKANEILERFYSNMNYSGAFKEVADTYAKWLIEKLYQALQDDGFSLPPFPTDLIPQLISPKEYNFVSDVIWVDLPMGFLPSPIDFDNKHTEYGVLALLDDEVRNNYTSYDGFISFVSNQVTDELLNGEFDNADPYHNSTYLEILCEYYFGDNNQNFITLENDFIEDYSGNGFFSKLIAKHCKDWNDIYNDIMAIMPE